MKKDPKSLMALQDEAIAKLISLPKSTTAYGRKHNWRGVQCRGLKSAYHHFRKGCEALGMPSQSTRDCWKDTLDVADLELIAA